MITDKEENYRNQETEGTNEVEDNGQLTDQDELVVNLAEVPLNDALGCEDQLKWRKAKKGKSRCQRICSMPRNRFL